MPDIKHNFTGGKMNKDLDERLVPNGEYRDAMNIQVQTSEGSDVGTIQNILGNNFGCDYTNPNFNNPVPAGSTTVGSISDEKNDSLYWLVAGPGNDGGCTSLAVDAECSFKDVIMRTSTLSGAYPASAVGCEPVFVDKYGWCLGVTISGQRNTVPIDPLLISNVTVGMSMTGYDNGVQEFTTLVTGIGPSNSIPMLSYYQGSDPVTPIAITNTWSVKLRMFTEQYSCGGCLSVSYMDATPDVNYGGAQQNVPPNGSSQIFLSSINQDVVIGATVSGSGIYANGGTITDIQYGQICTGYDSMSGCTLQYIITIDDTPTSYPSGSGFNTPPYNNEDPLSSFNIDITVQPAITYIPNNTIHMLPGSDPWLDEIYNILYDSSGNLTGAELEIDSLYGGGSNFPPNTCIDPASVINAADGFDLSTNSYDDFFELIECSSGTTPGASVDGLNMNPTNRPIRLIATNSVGVESVFLRDSVNLDPVDTLCFTSERVLNFEPNKLITGINIVDDMLFWTDGYHDAANKLQGTEPKKINITRSIQGTAFDGMTHTDLYVDGVSEGPVREEHVTVIRKAPLGPPTLEMTSQVREGILGGIDVVLFRQDYDTTSGLYTQNPPFTGVEEGDTRWVVIGSINGEHPNFEGGDILRIQAIEVGVEFDLPRDYHLRLEVVKKEPGPFDVPLSVISATADETAYQVRILTVADELKLNELDWYVELEEGDSLFERKFPRFAYRYKYVDNEYSSFGPFSEVAFIPGGFDYAPIEAYNIGMTNRVKSLIIKDFVSNDTPKDVVQVDILYKNETSPTVYLLDSVARDDSTDNWNTSSYKVSTESVFTALPTSQTLRSWDNVPRTSKAQEVTGNRLVYGNYLQGYDITQALGSSTILQPSITTTLASRVVDSADFTGKQSIKSLRTYDVGVVWGDKYGRETPVITSPGSSLTVPKSKSLDSSYLLADIGASPHWADYYRFYVKETSNEYYNLPVDRVYDAEDGNIWVSFPSVDRNKVDEDTYIILKKGIDSNSLILEDARYKIVAIENEAPEYIKTTYERLVRSNTDSSRLPSSCNMYGGTTSSTGCVNFDSGANAPEVGMKGFSLKKDNWSGDYSTADEQMGLTSPFTLWQEVKENSGGSTTDELFVSFTKEITSSTTGETQVTESARYQVVSVQEFTSNSNGYYYIKLKTPILPSDGFIVDDGNMANDNMHQHFWKKTIRNKPEFDGRFFVKILNDSTSNKNLKTEVGLVGNWKIATSLKLYKIDDSKLSISGPDYNYANTSNPSTTTKTQGQWNTILKFGGSSSKSEWFIDGASFASKQLGTPTDTIGNYASVKTDFPHPFSGTIDSCDLTSSYPQTLSGECWVLYGPVPVLTPFSINLGVATSIVGAGATLLGLSLPSNFTIDVGTGASKGLVGMKGVHETASAKYFDLAHSKIGPTGATGNTTNYDLEWDEADSEAEVIANLKPGKRFRLQGDTDGIIYKIDGTTRHRIFNHQGKKTANPSSFGAQGGVCNKFWNTKQDNQVNLMGDQRNRRVTYRIRYEVDVVSLADPDTVCTDPSNPFTGCPKLSDNSVYGDIDNINSVNLQFIEEFTTEGENPISKNPAIFETEPKEDVDLDLYYEASSSLPTFPITNENKHLYIPVGATIIPPPTGSSSVIFPEGVFITGWEYIDPSSPSYIINLSTPLTTSEFSFLTTQPYLVLLKDNGEIIQAEIIGGPLSQPDTSLPPPLPPPMVIGIQINPISSIGLSWFNCWSFNNGVESNRVGDTFNKPFLTNGATVSTTTEERFKEEHRKYGLIYSGLYNSNSGVNSLNQFIQAEKITKDINPTYGSIQKLHSGWGQGGDLVTLCEDRILKILANKDALYNADGNSNVTSTNNVLGQTIPYSGEFGISKNPESFASDAYRAYFTDKVRGTVMRLSMDGLTPISEHGMKDWFRDNLKLGGKIIGSYDDRQDEYNVNIVGASGGVVSFSERVKGWVSFKSFFQMEDGISCANYYYTFKDGNLYKHHDETVDRNTFYPYESSGAVVPGNYTDSSFTVLINESPGTVKTFHTLNYEGSQSKIDQLVTSTGTIGAYDTFIPGTTVVDTTYNSSEYYNLSGDDGWYVQGIKTDLEEGSLNEFIEKEGKWFNYIKGIPGSITDGANIDGFGSSDISFQGVGRLQFNPTTSSTEGCTDPTAFNYNPDAIISDGTCVAVVYGCTNNAAPNYDPLANTDDGSCIILGCTDNDPTTSGGVALNYDSNATVDDGSCTYSTYGCTGFGMGNILTPIINPTTGLFYPVYVNYDVTADVPCSDALSVPPPQNPPCVNDSMGVMQTGDDCCCLQIMFGCMDPTATNFDAVANTQPDATYCTYAPILGCMDTFACNYDNNADTDDGSCVYCGDTTASNVDNFDSADPSCIAQCLYCDNIADLIVDTTMSTTTDTIPVVWSETFSYPQAAGVDFYKLRYREVGCTSGGACWTVVNNIQPNVTMGTVSHLITNLTDDTEYVIQVKTMCYNSTSSWSTALSASTAVNLVQGCLDNTGAGNPEVDFAGNPATWGACNFDASANADASNVYMGNDYSNCDYTSCTGCMDVTYQEYCGDCWDTGTQQAVSGGGDSGWYGQLAGNCVTQWIYGCMDSTMFNYDPNATMDDNSCVPYIYGCTDNTTLDYSGNLSATNYDCATAINPGSSSPCTDGVNTDDGSCTYTTAISGSWFAYDDPAVNGAWWGDGWVFVMDAPSIPTTLSIASMQLSIGGQASTASMYGYNTNTLASIESQLYNNQTADLIHISNTSLITSGNGTSWDMVNVFQFAVPNISMIFESLLDTLTVNQGCMDSTMCNYDSTANAQGVWDCVVPYGCGDSTAINYDANTLIPPNCPEPNNAGCSWCEDPNTTDIDAWTVTWDSTNNTYMLNRAYDPSVDNGIYVMQGVDMWNNPIDQIVDFQWMWKPAGGSWSSWANAGNNGYENNCAGLLPQAIDFSGNSTVGLAGITDWTLNSVFAPGDKVKFKVRNRCHVNCGVGCSTCHESGWTISQKITLPTQ